MSNFWKLGLSFVVLANPLRRKFAAVPGLGVLALLVSGINSQAQAQVVYSQNFTPSGTNSYVLFHGDPAYTVQNVDGPGGGIGSGGDTGGSADPGNGAARDGCIVTSFANGSYLIPRSVDPSVSLYFLAENTLNPSLSGSDSYASQVWGTPSPSVSYPSFQDVQVIPGDRYIFTFWLTNLGPSGTPSPANPAEIVPVINGFNLLDNTAELGGPNFPTLSNGLNPNDWVSATGYYGDGNPADEWQKFSYEWTADSSGQANMGLYNLQTAAYGNDFAIDNISLTAVPEPSTLVLLVAGALGLLGVAWRRRRAMVRLVALIAALALVARAEAGTVTLTVVGSANPWLAGMPNGSTANGGDTAPAESPAQVVGIPISTGTTLVFSASGLAKYAGFAALTPPAGEAGVLYSDPAQNGISAVTGAPSMALMGVFLDNTEPDLSATPSPLDFSTQAEQDSTPLSPGLKQVFYIGDGFENSNPSQQKELIAPAGATRLFLGTYDGTQWNNNQGAFTVTVTAVPEPGSLALLGAGVLGLALVHLRRRRGGRLSSAARGLPKSFTLVAALAVLAVAWPVSAGTLRFYPNGYGTGAGQFPGAAYPYDVADNAIIIQDSSPTQAEADLQTIDEETEIGANFASGYWDGPGINSSAAANNSNGNTAVGEGTVQDLGLAGTNWGSYTLTNSDILIRYTYYGDANLDGQVTAADGALITFGTGNPLWENGDFDYNDVVDAADYSLYASNFGLATIPLPMPEPTSLALLGAALLGAGFVYLRRRIAKA